MIIKRNLTYYGQVSNQNNSKLSFKKRVKLCGQVNKNKLNITLKVVKKLKSAGHFKQIKC